MFDIDLQHTDLLASQWRTNPIHRALGTNHTARPLSQTAGLCFHWHLASKLLIRFEKITEVQNCTSNHVDVQTAHAAKVKFHWYQFLVTS